MRRPYGVVTASIDGWAWDLVRAVVDVAAIAGIYGSVLRWNAPSDHWSYKMPPYWLGGPRSWRAFRRAERPLGVGALSLGAGATFESTMPYAGIVFLGVVPLLVAMIALFNRPKWLVPPACRADQGLVEEWRTRRRLARSG